MGRKHSALVLNAARATVKHLERLNITCILISEVAACLLGGRFKPEAVELVIIPSYEGALSKEQVAVMLVEAEPTKFRIEHQKDGHFVLSYSDQAARGAASPPSLRKPGCPIELVNICNPPPPEYTADHVIRVDGLPVGSMLPLIVDKLRTLPFLYPPNPRDPSKPSKLPKQLRAYINWIHGHESLRQEALQCLIQASFIFPTLSPQLSTLVHECQKASSLARVRIKVPLSITRPPPMSAPVNIKPNHDRHFEISHTSSSVAESAPEVSHQLLSSLSRKAPRAPLRTEVVCLIAKTVVDIVRETGVECALFGSLACYLYGNTRSPNDVDLIAFSASQEPMDAERLKQLIAQRDPIHFCLGAPKDPTATYRILYFIVDQGLTPANTFHRNRCKIDVLVPGLLHLPSLSGSNIKWRGGLPVVPFPVLLLQKLQGWDDHMHMTEPYKFVKHETDAADVQELLKLEHIVSLRFSQPWGNRALFSQEFMSLSRWRIRQFRNIYPESAAEWSCIGFDV